MRDVGVRVRERQPVDPRELRAVGERELAAPRDVALQPPHAREQERRPRLVEAVVVAQSDGVVAGGLAREPAPRARRHAVAAQGARERRDVVIVGRHQAALAAGQHLVGEEAERARQAPGPQRAALQRRPGGMGHVLDQRQSMLVAQLPQLVDRRREPGEVHGGLTRRVTGTDDTGPQTPGHRK